MIDIVSARRRLAAAAAVIGAASLAGCVSDSSQTAATPVGSITPSAQMVSWSPGGEAQPVAGSPATPAPSYASLFATDDGYDGQTDYALMYSAIEGEKFPIAAAPLKKIDPAFLRTEVSYSTKEPPGTIIVDPAAHYLYLVEDGGKAIRYGVGVGRQGFGWSGDAYIKWKQEWPDWYPPKEMIDRQPELREKLSTLQSGIGMAGGPGNPLGVRALYLWQGEKDTLYRIHGTVEPWTIGKSVSSGCIRMINQDVMDLYARIPDGTRVVVLSAGESGA